MKIGIKALLLAVAVGLLAGPTYAGAPSGPVTLGDYSGDGRIDVLVEGSELLYVYVTDGTGAAVDAAESATIALPPAGFSVMAVADFNGDDHADTLVSDGTTMYVYITDATTAAGAPIAVDGAASGAYGAVPSGWSIVGAADANGDGNADVYLQNDSSGELYTYITAAGGVSLDWQASGSPVTVPAGWTITSIGDYNGDGRSDVLVTDAAGTAYTWTTNADGISFAASPASGSPIGIPAPWTWGGGGDYTSGTASSDLAIQNAGNGYVYVFATNADGVTVDAGASGLNVGSNGAGFSVQGIGDFNADGIADTLLGNAGGLLYVFLNQNATTIDGGGLVTTVPVGDGFSVPVNPGF